MYGDVGEKVGVIFHPARYFPSPYPNLNPINSNTKLNPSHNPVTTNYTYRNCK